MKVAASSLRKITLYLVTLLFVWVNGVAAPYQASQGFSRSQVFIHANSLQEGVSWCNRDTETAPSIAYQTNSEHDNGHPYSTLPAEENLEEKQEGTDGAVRLFNLPHYLWLGNLQKSHAVIPPTNNHDAHYAAVRNRCTYLVDCTFLI